MIWNIVQAQLALVLCWAVYKLILERSGMLRLSRAYLLVMPLLCSVLPFVDLTSNTAIGYAVTLPGVMLGDTQSLAVGTTNGVDILMIVSMVYLLGVLVVLGRVLLGAYQLIQLKAGAVAHPYYDNTYWLANSDRSFSYLGNIYLGDRLNNDKAELIYQHELQHKQLGHQWDRFYIMLFSAIWWSNPFVWAINREQQKVHEYQADRAMKHRVSLPDYYTALFEQATGVQVFDMSSQFADHSMTFKRIKMMEKVMTRSSRLWSVGLLIPVVSLMLYLGSCDSPKTTVTEAEMDEVAELEFTKKPDEMPEYNGGFAALGARLQEVLEYPAAAKAEGIEGTVFVSFIVTTDAKLVQAKVEKGVREDLDAAALAAVGELTDWQKPGVKDGKEVNVSMVLPIKFVLPKE